MSSVVVVSTSCSSFGLFDIDTAPTSSANAFKFLISLLVSPAADANTVPSDNVILDAVSFCKNPPRPEATSSSVYVSCSPASAFCNADTNVSNSWPTFFLLAPLSSNPLLEELMTVLFPSASSLNILVRLPV